MFSTSSIYPKAILLAVVALLFVPTVAFAATLYISPESDTYTMGRNFSVRVRVNTNQSINAVSGTVTYPPDKLQAVSVSKIGSILTLWVEEPTFNNNSGRVSFEGVVPNPGYTGQGGQVIVINFRVVGAGSASLSFTGASVLANDGSGSNVLTGASSATYSLGGVADTPPVTPVSPPTTTGTPPAPQVSSPTHSVPSKWYKAKDGVFNWTVGSDVVSTRLLLGKSPNSTPTEIYTPPITSKEIKDIEEGIWYLHVQNKNSKGWGGVSRFAVRVDYTAPEVFVMKEIERGDPTEPRVKLSLTATDNFSGIKSFGIQVDKEEEVQWIDDGTGLYNTPPLKPGAHTIFARAYDEAGNFASASTNVVVAPIEAPTITSYTERVTGDEPLIIKGTSFPGAIVEISLKKSNSDEISHTQRTEADAKGSFTIVASPQEIKGAFELTAIAIDKRGASSLPTAPVVVLINASILETLGNNLIKTLAVAVPVLALLFILVVIFMRGFHHVRMTNAKFRKEIHDIERLVDKALVLLKEDVEDSIRLLERTKTRRKLTDEEDSIIERLRQNLRDAEKVIHSEVRRVEKELD